eukprot:SAG31_NODE_2869_length_4976_cov_1.541111_2_plen_71_part_00
MKKLEEPCNTGLSPARAYFCAKFVQSFECAIKIQRSLSRLESDVEGLNLRFETQHKGNLAAATHLQEWQY